MNILSKNVDTTTSVSSEIEKGVESLVFYSDVSFNDLSTEEISLQVERSGGSNLEITQGFVSLKSFLLAATFGSDAIGSFPASFQESFKTVCLVELTELGSLMLLANDKLLIKLKGLVPMKQYQIDGIESPLSSSDIYLYEEKSVAQVHKNYDLNVRNYDIAIIEDNGIISELNFTHDNGIVTKHSLRELRAVSQDMDPIAYVQNNGQVVPSLVGYIQFPMKGIVNINVRKNDTSIVKFFFRKDVDLVSLGLIK